MECTFRYRFILEEENRTKEAQSDKKCRPFELLVSFFLLSVVIYAMVGCRKAVTKGGENLEKKWSKEKKLCPQECIPGNVFWRSNNMKG